MFNYCHAVLRSFAHHKGLSPLMLRARRQARNQDARLSFHSDYVCWKRRDQTALLPANRPYEMNSMLSIIEGVMRHAVPTLVDNRLVVDLRGPCCYELPSGAIYWSRTAPENVDTLGGYVARGGAQPGDIAMDAGACVGEITLELAARVGPTGHVYALEPDPESRRLLERNLLQNRVHNVTVLPYALWHTSCDLQFLHDRHYGSMLYDLVDRNVANSRTITVPAISPADLFAQIGCVPSFIKMDVEGAEVEIIPALAAHYAAISVGVRLAIASYHRRNGRPSSDSITPPLEAAGFEVETGYPEHQTTWARRQ